MAPKKGSTRTRKQLAPLDFNKITVARVSPGAEMTAHRPTRGTRDDNQRAIDDLVTAAWDAWIEQGRSEHWDDQPGMFLAVDASEVETVQTLIRRAGQYLRCRIRFGKITEGVDGRSEVVFTATDPKKDDTETAGDTES